MLRIIVGGCVLLFEISLTHTPMNGQLTPSLPARKLIEV